MFQGNCSCELYCISKMICFSIEVSWWLTSTIKIDVLAL